MRRERVRLTPLAGSARKALPFLLAAVLLAAPGAAGANSGGMWDNLDGDPWYVGNGGGSNGNITIDEAMTSYASGGLIYKTSATDVTLDKNAVTVKDGADGDGVYGATITCDVPGTVTMKGNQVTVYGGHYYSVFGAHINSLLGIVFNGFCFINLIPHFFDYLMCPYYPAYTMGCYQIVIGGDNGG